MKTNWDSVVWWYATWQKRHSRFALDIAPRTNPAAVGLLSGEVPLALQIHVSGRGRDNGETSESGQERVLK